MKEDIRIKYEQVIQQFDIPGLLPPELQMTDVDSGERLTGQITFNNVSYGEDGGKVLEGVTCTVPLDRHTAVPGGAGTRPEERRVGKACVSTCRSRWSP